MPQIGEKVARMPTDAHTAHTLGLMLAAAAAVLLTLIHLVATRCLLHVVCCTLSVACRLFHGARCLVHAVCCTLHVARLLHRARACRRCLR